MLAPRPKNIPQDWLISLALVSGARANGTRLLWASVNENALATWVGECLRGEFYAAVNPTDPQTSLWPTLDVEDHAVLLNYKTSEEVRAWMREYVRREQPDIDFAELDFKDIHGCYLANNAERELEIEIEFEGDKR